MALAFMCQEVTKGDSKLLAPLIDLPDYPKISTPFAAFIVDHKIREESTAEAHSVAAAVEKLGIEAHVLDLGWRPNTDSSELANLETTVRRLRYQAIGKACRDRSCNSLLLAHHANDQHETVLSRIYANYLGSGLHGMDENANIPECTGIHGVDRSGRYDHQVNPQWLGDSRRGRILFESGGVNIWRPLLHLQKQTLKDICMENDVKWFEDHTNSAPTLTIRNTIRHLVQKEELPKHLQLPWILKSHGRIRSKQKDLERAADECFNSIPLVLDLRTGVATFDVTKEIGETSDDDYTKSAMVVRRLLDTVSPKDTISLQGLDTAVDLVFYSKTPSDKQGAAQVAGVQTQSGRSKEMDGDTQVSFMMHRSLPMRQERDAKRMLIHSSSQNLTSEGWSGWVLWDGRYWIRIRPPRQQASPEAGNLEVRVDFLTKDNLEALRKTLDPLEIKHLNKHLDVAKGKIRFTLPVIVTQEPGQTFERETREKVVALPTLDWSVGGWSRDSGGENTETWLWDVRYKHVDLNLRSKVHEVISRYPRIRPKHKTRALNPESDDG